MRAIVVDDERPARRELRRLLTAHPEVQVIAEAGSADEARYLSLEQQPDLMFLDIEMPGKNAFALLEELAYTPAVIFTTAYDAFAVKAFELNALDYLLKPIDPQRLSAALERARAHYRARSADTPLLPTGPERIFVRDRERCWFVALEDIFLFESEGNYTRLYFGTQRPLILRSLHYLEERLDAKSFFRAGRRYIINLKHIRGLQHIGPERLRVEMPGAIQVDMSRRQSRAFRDMMSL